MVSRWKKKSINKENEIYETVFWNRKQAMKRVGNSKIRNPLFL